jgi:uncharacterized protein (UPF0548 family)
VLPNGYRHLSRHMIIGQGTGQFADAAQALLGWQMYLCSGLRVSTSSATAKRDAVVVLGIGAGLFALSAPCRVVYIIDEPTRQGFAFGNLPGHPESGEESFVIERANDNTVSFSITAFSTPASVLAKLAGPLGRLAQHLITARYLRSLALASIVLGRIRSSGDSRVP